MITAGMFDMDCGVVLLRAEFEKNGINPYADTCGEYYIYYAPMGRLKSCPGCSKMVRDLDGILFWKFPEMFTADDGEVDRLCVACRRC